MAGAGWRDFVAGEVLTAANVQDYLQDQAVMTFASSGARGSAIASPTEGMVSYLSDSNLIESYTGSAWERQTGGLIPISPSSVTFVTGSGSVNSKGEIDVVNCSAIDINGVFTSAYRNYKVVMSRLGGNVSLDLRMLASGTPNTTANYKYSGVSTNSTTVSIFSNGTNTLFPVLVVNVADGVGSALIHLLNPFQGLTTNIQVESGSFDGQFLSRSVKGFHQVAASYDGIRIFAASNTFFGSVQVFGYND